uniref:uncharacterized protein n=1 Tax=Pristiophorus japonicus TaxID=55135 RepID=UPI00398F573F
MDRGRYFIIGLSRGAPGRPCCNTDPHRPGGTCCSTSGGPQSSGHHRGVAGPLHAPPLPAPEAQREDRCSNGPDPLHVSLTMGGEEEETTEFEEEEEYLETEEDVPCIPLTGEPAATMGIPTEEVPEPSGMQLAMPRRTLVLSQTPWRPGQWLEQRPTLDHRMEHLARLCEESFAIQREQLQVFVGFTSQAKATQQMILELHGISASNHAMRHAFLAVHSTAPRAPVTTSTATQVGQENAPPPDSEGDPPVLSSPPTGDRPSMSPTTVGSLAIAHCTLASQQYPGPKTGG